MADTKASEYESLLDMKHHFPISRHLKELENDQIIDVGSALGINHAKLKRMRSLPSDMVAAWLRKEDNVLEVSGVPTWKALTKALSDNGQTGLATKIQQQYQPGNTTTPSGQAGGALPTPAPESTTSDFTDGGTAVIPNGSGKSGSTESTDGNNGAQGGAIAATPNDSSAPGKSGNTEFTDGSNGAQGGAIAATPNDSSTPVKSGNTESTEESNGAQGGECSSSKKLITGPLNLDKDKKSKIDLLHDGIQKYLQENDRLDDEHELCTKSNREFFEKCDLSSYDCKKYKSSSTNVPQRSCAGKASNRQAGDKTTMVTAEKKKSRETLKRVTSTTSGGFNKFGVTGKQQVAMSYGTKRGSEEGEAVGTPVDFQLDESTDVQTAYEIWPMETEIKDLPIILPKDMPLYYHKIGKKMCHGPLHIGQKKVDLKGIEEIKISGIYRWEYEYVASIKLQ